MARDVFISYRSPDKEAAQRVCASLEHENISCWMAPRDISIGKEWATAIVEGIQRCRSLLLILSSNSKDAKQISREAELADSQGIPIFTLRIEDVQPPPGLLYFLGNLQWLDAFGGQFDSALARLVDVIKESPGYPAEKTTIRTHEPEGKPATPSSSKDPGFSTSSAGSPLPPGAPSGLRPAGAEGPLLASEPNVRNGPFLWMGMGAASVILLGLIGWFWFHQPASSPAPGSRTTSAVDAKTRPTPNSGRVARSDLEAEAKVFADRFLRDVDSGDLEVAWNELTPAFRDKLDKARWEKNAENARKRRANAEAQFNGCSPDGQERFVCNYTFVEANGVAEHDRLNVLRTENGSWAIAGSILQRQP